MNKILFSIILIVFNLLSLPLKINGMEIPEIKIEGKAGNDIKLALEKAVDKLQSIYLLHRFDEEFQMLEDGKCAEGTIDISDSNFDYIGLNVENMATMKWQHNITSYFSEKNMFTSYSRLVYPIINKICNRCCLNSSSFNYFWMVSSYFLV